MENQEAITWLEQIKVKYIHGGVEFFDDCRRRSIDIAIKALRQPQIVRCKDCKHYMPPGADGSEKGDCFIKMGYFPVSQNWFCADGEKKQNDALKQLEV